MKEEDFYLKVAYALSGCQMVEQELKLYLTEALDLVRKRLGDRMPFKMKGDDYENSSLERLIEVFNKLTNNNDLVKELRKFKEERNFLSHQGIAHCLDYERDLFHTKAADFEDRLAKIKQDAHLLRSQIHEEANKFRGYLWFEDIQQ